MSSSLVEAQQQEDAQHGQAQPEPEGSRGFDVVTTHSDGTRANLRARGTLDVSSAPLLAGVIAGHLRARRRFVRVDVAGLAVADGAATAVLAQAHQQLLAARGTLILTGVSEELRRALASAGLDRELFMISPSAFETGHHNRR